MPQAKHTIELTERELRVVLHAFDIARDDTLHARAEWWRNTRHVAALYARLVKLPLLAGR